MVHQVKRTAPDNNPKTAAGGMHKVPLHLVSRRAIAVIAMAMADGAFKYCPYNYRDTPISASVYHGAASRHLDAWWEGEDKPDDGIVHHLAYAAACCIIALDGHLTGMLNDNRPPTGDALPWSEFMADLASHLETLSSRDNTKFDLHDMP